MKAIFFIIIIFIIVRQLIDEYRIKQVNQTKTETQVVANNNETIHADTEIDNELSVIDNDNDKEIIDTTDLQNNNEYGFETPRPWTRMIKKKGQYPYHFHIKVRIQSLNDLENWKQVVPNIYFIPSSGELVIPSKDEGSALALANLIISNFMGQLSLQDILEKNLIQISVNKAKYEVVRNKLREQIIDNIAEGGGSKVNSNLASYEMDAAQSSLNSSEVQPYDGSDFSYL